MRTVQTPGKVRDSEQLSKEGAKLGCSMVLILLFGLSRSPPVTLLLLDGASCKVEHGRTDISAALRDRVSIETEGQT